MEYIFDMLVELVYFHRNDLFNRRRNKMSIQKKQNVWSNIHNNLIQRGVISPSGDWRKTRAMWYRIVHIAKKSLTEYNQGLIPRLPDKHIFVLRLVNKSIKQEKLQRDDDPLTFHCNENEMEVVTETTEIIKPIESNFLGKSEISETELQRKILIQKYKINEYKLLKIKYDLINIDNEDFREEFLKILQN